ncbi:MAG TPA: 5-formyltetrahydrofolate cyclo-ligase, partial [Cytophagaceae bacterium]|nr:5-formyltetrahydrofolate cyclo-ligase [Cytophagaceae bacterium]
MNKKELRKLYIEKRNALTVEECHAMSLSIADNFFNHIKFSLSDPMYLHLFLPIKEKKELNTFIILERILADFPNMKIALSKSNFMDYSMQFFEYTEETKLVENSYGIPEPVGGNLIKPEQLDMILMPLLVADEAGNRIGYGKGFYDRFLTSCRAECKKIGLSFENPVPVINADVFDVPLDFCITP